MKDMITISNEFIDCFQDPKMIGVYAWLKRHGADSDDGAVATVDDIARGSGVGINNVRKILKYLSDDGWLTIDAAPGWPSRYFTVH